MPRGDNPNSRKNLLKNSERNPKEHSEASRKGGKKSGEVRRALKSFKELDDENTTDEMRLKMLEVLMKRAIQGNLKAFEIYRDTVGLKPAEHIKLEDVNEDTIEEMRREMEMRQNAEEE